MLISSNGVKIFEFQFNPKIQKDHFLKVFTFESDKEENLERGSMYIVGELENALPSNSTFLTKLATTIKDEYYAFGKTEKETTKKKIPSPEASLKNSLKKANEFLEQETKKGNVDWLGNLQFGVLVFIATSQGHLLYFSKVGGMKIWMARKGSLVDVGKNLENSETTNQSTKVFGNVGSGKVIAGDQIIVLTKDLFELFVKQNLLQPISQIKEDKQFRNIFKEHEKALSNTSGVLLIFLIEEIVSEAKQERKTPASKAKRKILPLRMPNLSFQKLAPSSFSRIPLPHVSFVIPSFSKSKNTLFQRFPLLKKRISLFLILSVVLLIGFVVFGGRMNQIPEDTEAVFEKGRALQIRAENALVLNDDRAASALFQEARTLILPYTTIEEMADKEKRVEFLALKDEIERRLFSINKIEDIADPNVFLEIQKQENGILPSQMILDSENVYLFDPFSSDVSVFNIETKVSVNLQAGSNVKHGGYLGNTPVFFAEPDILLSLDTDQNWNRITLPLFNTDFRFDIMSAFRNNLYFIDGTTGTILKYTNPLSGETDVQSWIDAASAQRPLDAQSMTIDGNIWILAMGNEIQRYFKGRHQENLDITIFPALVQASYIKTRPDIPYLYILDSSENRLVIVTKFGDIIKQYRSPAFENLSDFALSEDGKTVYLLNGAKIYEISDIPLDL